LDKSCVDLILCSQKEALSLCRFFVIQKQRYKAAYFEAVRILLTHITGEGKPLSLKAINVQQIM
jgi:type I restriction enzyme R subunit